MTPRVVNPITLPTAVGFSYGVLAGGPLVALSGQNGHDSDGVIVDGGLVAQFDRCLANLLTVVAAAGGEPESVIQMTVYVTDIAAYRASRGELAAVWRRHFGTYYPAMALVAVSGLYEPEAVVEIEGWAAVASDRSA